MSGRSESVPSTRNQAYLSQAEDTAPEIDRLLVEQWRSMPPSEKLRRVVDDCRAVEQLAVAGILHQHPGADEREVRFRLATRRFGRDTAVALMRWDPDA